MNDAQPFLDAICANPAEDAPRLVFADWLEERGECARAEFIRVQIELEKYPRGIDDPRPSRTIRLAEKLHREQELFDVIGSGLRDDLPWMRHTIKPETFHGREYRCCLYSRGFVASIRCTLADWCGGPGVYGGGSDSNRGSPSSTSGRAGEICLHHPIESVTLTCRRPHMPMPEIRPQYATWSAGKTDGANTAFTHILPEELYLHLESWVSRSSVWVAYQTEADALAALDRAAVKLGRERAEALRKARR